METSQASILPDAGHQWQIFIAEFILSLGFTVIPGVPKLFVQRTASEDPPAEVSKVTDDILIVGTPDALELFIRDIQASFEVDRVQYHTNMALNGAFISVAPQGFTLDITEPLARLQNIPIEPDSRCCPLQPIKTDELTALRSL
jgi:hypothetical protein